MTDQQRLKELADKYGDDNPAVAMAEWICKGYPGGIREDNFWEQMAETAAYCNEPMDLYDAMQKNSSTKAFAEMTARQQRAATISGFYDKVLTSWYG
jgi:hypothetical protein